MLETKGLLMLAIAFIFAISIGYYVLIKSAIPAVELPDLHGISNRIKRDINEYFKKTVCLSISVDIIEGLYENFNDRQDDTYLIVGKVRLKRMDKCISIMIADLNESTIQIAIVSLIKQIEIEHKKLKITC